MLALTFFLLRPLTPNAQSSGETLYLPLVSQPLFEPLPSDQQDHIQWVLDEAPYPAVSAQAVTLSVGEHEYLFLLGGAEQFNPQTKRVEQTKRVTRVELHENGDLGSWSSVGDLQELPRRLHGFTATAVNNRIYVLGGMYYPAGGGLPKFNNTAYCAEINEDGTFARWEAKQQNWYFDDGASYNYEKSMAYHAAVYLNDHLYVIGGLRRGLYFSQSWDATKFVFSAEVGDSCDALDWQQEQGLPEPLRGHSAVALERASGSEHDIYLFGGITNNQNNPTAVSLRAKVGVNGIEGWTDQPVIPGSAGIHAGTAVRSDEYVYFIAGTTQYDATQGPARDNVYRTKILPDGELQPWQEANSLAHLYGHAAAVSTWDRLYIVGGAIITNSTQLPTPQNTIYWTPLLFFSKESEPAGAVFPGETIQFRFTIRSNNVRDLPSLVISDTLPSNLELVSAPNFVQNGRLLHSISITLPVNSQAWQTLTAVVIQPETPVSNDSPSATATETALPTNTATLTVTSTPTAVPPTATPPIRPTDDKSCVLPEAAPDSGTPRPKPTCTPTPVVTVSVMPTSTITVTPTETDTPPPIPTDTTTPTTVPEPVVVINVAQLCFEGRCIWTSTVINAENRLFLPQIAK
ncbi:hypothetical protein [Candidatus Leptofilum sp.]|uniref:hypothetical protein n=1 Tax=Candidatus Leptofilum sp. TaxID=3241576 RepID=UPI003B5BF187